MVLKPSDSLLQSLLFSRIVRVSYSVTIRVNFVLSIPTSGRHPCKELDNDASQADENKQARSRFPYDRRHILEREPARRPIGRVREADGVPQFPVVGDATHMQVTLQALATDSTKRAWIARVLFDVVERMLPTGRIRREADRMPQIALCLSADVEIVVYIACRDTDRGEAVWRIRRRLLHIFERLPGTLRGADGVPQFPIMSDTTHMQVVANAFTINADERPGKVRQCIHILESIPGAIRVTDGMQHAPSSRCR